MAKITNLKKRRRRKSSADPAKSIELILRTQQGDERAFVAYKNLHEGLIGHIINKHARGLCEADLCDVYQEALLGLHKGMLRFKPNKLAESGKPESYVFAWVRAYVTRFVKKNVTRISPERNALPIHTIADEDLHGWFSVGNYISDGRPLPNTWVDQEQIIECIGTFLLSLPYRERTIVEKRLLREKCDRESLRMIGEEFNITHERVRQIALDLQKGLGKFASEMGLI